MAELADAQRSGRCFLKKVQVQILFRVLNKSRTLLIYQLLGLVFNHKSGKKVAKHQKRGNDFNLLPLFCLY